MNRRPVARPRRRLGDGHVLAVTEGLSTAAGVSLAEVLLGLGIAAVVATAALPQLRAGLDEYRTRGATRYVAGRLQQTRMEAVARSTNMAVRFTAAGASYTFVTLVDGDRDGVSSRDIQDGVDAPIGPIEALSSRFPGVDFGMAPGLPSTDGTPLDGADPFRFGSSHMVSFTPLGTATAGSVYIRGRVGAQYVVRVYGDTGKTQALRFDARRGRWVPL